MPKKIRKTSMQDIADYLNISKNAVSLALNDKPGIGPELKERVLQAARYLNYANFGLLRAEESNKNLLIMVPEYISDDRFFYPEIYWAIEKQTRSAGINAVMAIISSEMEDTIIFPELLRYIDVSGIVIVGVLRKAYIQEILKTGLPVLMADNYYHDLPIGSVVTANEEGAYSITKHLIENGHRKIGFIAPIDMTASFYERWEGYRKAMHDYKLPVDEGYCVLSSTPTRKFFSKPEELEPYIAPLTKYPTAWFCGNDITAMVLINTLLKKKIQVPRDISVVGFDDIEAARLFIPSLTTMRVKRSLLGTKVVDNLLQLMKGEAQQIMKISIYTELIVRDSVRNI